MPSMAKELPGVSQPWTRCLSCTSRKAVTRQIRVNTTNMSLFSAAQVHYPRHKSYSDLTFRNKTLRSRNVNNIGACDHLCNQEMVVRRLAIQTLAQVISFICQCLTRFVLIYCKFERKSPFSNNRSTKFKI